MVHGRSLVETLHQKALRVFSATCCNETQRRSVLCGEWMVDYLVGGSNCFKVCFFADSPCRPNVNHQQPIRRF
jgi:hypothetical protein